MYYQTLVENEEELEKPLLTEENKNNVSKAYPGNSQFAIRVIMAVVVLFWSLLLMCIYLHHKI